MGVLQRFERRLEGMVGLAFARLFKGKVHPAEIAKALQREADEQRSVVGEGRILAPNVYVVRLGDTELIIEIEHDYISYGEESIFGGGKSIRDGQDQCPVEEPMSPEHCDLVVTNAVIIDHWGIVKGDIGIREGRIVAVGKSGNPLTQKGVDPRLVIGPRTEVIAGEGRIVTAGGVDTHIHFICPQQIETAIASGITTLIGGGTGSATGTWATT